MTLDGGKVRVLHIFNDVDGQADSDGSTCYDLEVLHLDKIEVLNFWLMMKMITSSAWLIYDPLGNSLQDPLKWKDAYNWLLEEYVADSVVEKLQLLNGGSLLASPTTLQLEKDLKKMVSVGFPGRLIQAVDLGKTLRDLVKGTVEGIAYAVVDLIFDAIIDPLIPKGVINPSDIKLPGLFADFNLDTVFEDLEDVLGEVGSLIPSDIDFKMPVDPTGMQKEASGLFSIFEFLRLLGGQALVELFLQALTSRLASRVLDTILAQQPNNGGIGDIDVAYTDPDLDNDLSQLESDMDVGVISLNNMPADPQAKTDIELGVDASMVALIQSSGVLGIFKGGLGVVKNIYTKYTNFLNDPTHSVDLRAITTMVLSFALVVGFAMLSLTGAELARNFDLSAMTVVNPVVEFAYAFYQSVSKAKQIITGWGSLEETLQKESALALYAGLGATSDVLFILKQTVLSNGDKTLKFYIQATRTTLSALKFIVTLSIADVFHSFGRVIDVKGQLNSLLAILSFFDVINTLTSLLIDYGKVNDYNLNYLYQLSLIGLCLGIFVKSYKTTDSLLNLGMSAQSILVNSLFTLAILRAVMQVYYYSSKLEWMSLNETTFKIVVTSIGLLGLSLNLVNAVVKMGLG